MRFVIEDQLRFNDDVGRETRCHGAIRLDREVDGARRMHHIDCFSSKVKLEERTEYAAWRSCSTLGMHHDFELLHWCAALVQIADDIHRRAGGKRAKQRPDGSWPSGAIPIDRGDGTIVVRDVVPLFPAPVRANRGSRYVARRLGGDDHFSMGRRTELPHSVQLPS